MSNPPAATEGAPAGRLLRSLRWLWKAPLLVIPVVVTGLLALGVSALLTLPFVYLLVAFCVVGVGLALGPAAERTWAPLDEPSRTGAARSDSSSDRPGGGPCGCRVPVARVLLGSRRESSSRNARGTGPCGSRRARLVGVQARHSAHGGRCRAGRGHAWCITPRRASWLQRPDQRRTARLLLIRRCLEGQLRGCLDHVTRDHITHLRKNAARFARGELDRASLKLGLSVVRQKPIVTASLTSKPRWLCGVQAEPG